MTFDEWWRDKASEAVRYAHDVAGAWEYHLRTIYEAGAASERKAREIAEGDSEACARQMLTERERADMAEARIKELAPLAYLLPQVSTATWKDKADLLDRENVRLVGMYDAMEARVRELEGINGALRLANAHALGRAEKAEAAFVSAKANAKCNCAPTGNGAIECGLPCECRCHEPESALAACREELDKHHDTACSSYGGYECDCNLEHLLDSPSNRGLAEKRAERAEAERDAALAQVAALRKALEAALGSHFNLYRAHWGERADPNNDIVRRDLLHALASTAPKDGDA